LLEMQGVGKTYAGEGAAVVAIRCVNLTVRAGEFVSIVGPSGCGKSTLLQIVAGLLPATTGEVRLDGKPIVEPPRWPPQTPPPVAGSNSPTRLAGRRDFIEV